ncbi:FAD-dependent monooxygenase [Stackebrandtia nassauensis]|uniref:Monooxygenase FAD-binding protein n=1 Tax=Stackebrandtia nassauensis (strain DSM 44728 / CIP 108903 / NRRL B-16338 / NBRC 102104 / LLR-40K-21) TaxID=446470 RepID=D3PXF5_STANL|nr:FAD-dependent monooxygenase [Stackebrandtia nassauensis]ADD41418.1 monooxygenase FAD-binding protein [Stackebrandtia nassauensis DSM 44728]
MTTPRTVLISGAGIGGPALAYWLARYGFAPTVVEIARELRTGGQPVDFRGETHRTVLTRMGIWDDLQATDTGGSPFSFVDETGRQLAALPGEFAGGEVEIRRGDLSRLLYERTRSSTEYLFGDSITRLTQRADGVAVEFASGTRRRFDLVIGADGVHSNVRRLTMGPESKFVKQFDYYVAFWSLRNDFDAPPITTMYNVPGKVIGVAADAADPARAYATVFFASPPLEYDRHDPRQQKDIVARQFTGVGWHAPRLLAGLREATDLYFDGIVKVTTPQWSKGRTALLGDAAYGATIGGMGAGTSMVGAYTLAGELATSGGDHQAAFATYQERLAKYVRKCQRGGEGAGRFFAPRGKYGPWLRNRMFNSAAFMKWMLKIADSQAENVELPDYPALLRGSAATTP